MQGADLTDMQWMSKFNKKVWFLLVGCCFEKQERYYNCITVTKAFQEILDESGRKPKKYQQKTKESPLLLKDLLEP